MNKKKGLYFNVNLILVLISVILTIIVLNFHFRGPKKQRVPRWMRKFIIGYLGRAFCFCYESNTYFKIHQEEQEFRLKTRHQAALKDEQHNDHHNDHQYEPAYSKLIKSNSNQNKIVLDLNDDEEDEGGFRKQTTSSNHIVKSPSANLGHCNKNSNLDLKRSTSSTTVSNRLSKSQTKLSKEAANSTINFEEDLDFFNENLSKNLERILIKMQKSFDPFKLNDESLKFAILKEILECQRLLLTANLTSSHYNSHHNHHHSHGGRHKNKHQITINEIYDEWKILAMIVDRICFFVYLSALVFSSVLFFLSEHIYDDGS
jgi:hypothetical protein